MADILGKIKLWQKVENGGLEKDVQKDLVVFGLAKKLKEEIDGFIGFKI